MAYAPSHTVIDLPRTTSASAKRYLMSVADEFATTPAAKPFEPTEYYEYEWELNYINPMDAIDDDLSVDTDDEPDDYPSDHYDRDIFDEPHYYDYLIGWNDDEPACDIAGCDDVPSIHCDTHGDIYDRHQRVGYLHSPFSDLDMYCDGCDFGRLPSVRCPQHGYVFDESWLGTYADYCDYHDDNCLGNEPDLLEMAQYEIAGFYDDEYSFVETYWRLTPLDIERDRHAYSKYKAFRRREINSLPRIKRREGSIHMRGRYESERFDEQYVAERYNKRYGAA